MPEEENTHLRVEYDDLDIHGFDLGGTEIMHFQGRPFTGIETTTENGVLTGEREFQNGYCHGIQREYHYLSGVLIEEFTMIDNSFDGDYKRWDEQGNLISRSVWDKGKRIS